MRLRIAVLASALSALGAASVPGIVTAAPHHNRGLTINATPNPINAGDPVLIYGQLNDTPIAGQTIVLYHRIAGHGSRFTRVGQTTTNSTGFYQFTRADGVVMTNRAWFVREAGDRGVHSRTVYEKVAALVSICATASSPGASPACSGTVTADTNHAVVFSGHVTPNHDGERVLLQQEQGSSDDWTTLKSARLGEGSNYRIAYKWRVPGDHDVRVVFRKQDARNETGASDSVTVTIQQTQEAGFTINTSQPIVPEGTSVTISGVLDQPGTTTPEPNTVVALYGRTADQSHFHAIGTPVSTGEDGSYSLSDTPAVNTIYQVRTVLKPKRHTAALFEGVQDVLTLSSTSSTATIGQTVTFNGTISPATKVGRWIYLQLQGVDGDWHNVEAVRIASNSAYQFTYAFGQAGTFNVRARKYGDEHNVGAASAPVTITVSGNTAPGSLPPSS